ncbi:histidine kinase dimerization/phospho-acceptor domain-containing protein [Achromobacter sp.]|uniref:histidine kinase dimerization/phospho-acceptor domain-containing protein n=1 Tax=Achromobacter sp. TaxID=134375 RepID=UPI003C752666
MAAHTPGDPEPEAADRPSRSAISILNRYQRALLHAADTANQAKSAFLATMSHEIRTPLNAILGNLELLERSGLSAAQRERLRAVTSSSATLLDIINAILDFSKVESGQMSVESIPFDLAEAARQVIAVFTPAAQAKGLELELELDCIIDDGLAPRYLGDPTRVRETSRRQEAPPDCAYASAIPASA